MGGVIYEMGVYGQKKRGNGKEWVERAGKASEESSSIGPLIAKARYHLDLLSMPFTFTFLILKVYPFAVGTHFDFCDGP